MKKILSNEWSGNIPRKIIDNCNGGGMPDILFARNVFFLLLMVSPLAVNAMDFGSALPVSVSGFVNISPPCTINNDLPLTIDFQTVLDRDINGLKNSGKVFNLSVDCGSADKNEMQVTFSGKKSVFDAPYGVATSDENVSIRFYHNDDLSTLDQPFPYSENIQFTAALQKNPSVQLKGGPFTASATVKIDYK